MKLKRALVIGASFSGLCAARVLSDHFEEVWVLEKDALLQGTRKGLPQHLHSHVLMAQGAQQLNAFFPELEAQLRASGAHKTDIGTYACWYQWGGWKKNARAGISALSCSRALLETALREQVAKLPNMQFLEGHKVLGLQSQPDARGNLQVTGVEVQKENSTFTLDANLVVDGSGRGSQASKWLEQLGYAPPVLSEIPARVGYVTCKYRMPDPDPLKGQALLITPAAPQEKRAGLALPIEDQQWTVTLAGWCGDHPEATHAGILQFAKSLPVPDLYQILAQTEPTTEAVRHLIPSSLRRHFERLTRFPKGFLVMGDALCSFNPTYGQGITVAALEAHHLQDCLQESQGDLKDLWRWFFKRIQPVVSTAWSMVELEDSRYFPDHPLKNPQRWVQRYLVRLHRATTRDEKVSLAFFRVLNMMDPPQALFHPEVLWRVLLKGQVVPSGSQEVYQRSSRL